MANIYVRIICENCTDKNGLVVHSDALLVAAKPVTWTCPICNTKHTVELNLESDPGDQAYLVIRTNVPDYVPD